MQAGASNYTTVALWKSGTGLDTNSITSDPNLTASYTLNSGSPAVGRGLTSRASVSQDWT